MTKCFNNFSSRLVNCLRNFFYTYERLKLKQKQKKLRFVISNNHVMLLVTIFIQKKTNMNRTTI